MTIVPCVHYVGFTGDEYLRARRVFGGPAFIHRKWGLRARRETWDGDTVVFATGPHDQQLSDRNGNDYDE